MTEREKFRYAEKCLYGYKRNMACLDILRQDLKLERAGNDVHAQNYQLTFGFSGEPSSPVQKYVEKLETLERRIKYLERWTVPISRLLKDLNSSYSLTGSKNADLLQIVKLMYMGETQAKRVKIELKLSERTFTRRRRELVRLAIGYLGL